MLCSANLDANILVTRRPPDGLTSTASPPGSSQLKQEVTRPCGDLPSSLALQAVPNAAASHSPVTLQVPEQEARAPPGSPQAEAASREPVLPTEPPGTAPQANSTLVDSTPVAVHLGLIPSTSAKAALASRACSEGGSSETAFAIPVADAGLAACSAAVGAMGEAVGSDAQTRLTGSQAAKMQDGPVSAAAASAGSEATTSSGDHGKGPAASRTTDVPDGRHAAQMGQGLKMGVDPEPCASRSGQSVAAVEPVAVHAASLGPDPKSHASSSGQDMAASEIVAVQTAPVVPDLATWPDAKPCASSSGPGVSAVEPMATEAAPEPHASGSGLGVAALEPVVVHAAPMGPDLAMCPDPKPCASSSGQGMAALEPVVVPAAPAVAGGQPGSPAFMGRTAPASSNQVASGPSAAAEDSKAAAVVALLGEAAVGSATVNLQTEASASKVDASGLAFPTTAAAQAASGPAAAAEACDAGEEAAPDKAASEPSDHAVTVSPDAVALQLAPERTVPACPPASVGSSQPVVGEPVKASEPAPSGDALAPPPAAELVATGESMLSCAELDPVAQDAAAAHGGAAAHKPAGGAGATEPAGASGEAVAANVAGPVAAAVLPDPSHSRSGRAAVTPAEEDAAAANDIPTVPKPAANPDVVKEAALEWAASPATAAHPGDVGHTAEARASWPEEPAPGASAADAMHVSGEAVESSRARDSAVADGLSITAGLSGASSGSGTSSPDPAASSLAPVRDAPEAESALLAAASSAAEAPAAPDSAAEPGDSGPVSESPALHSAAAPTPTASLEPAVSAILPSSAQTDTGPVDDPVAERTPGQGSMAASDASWQDLQPEAAIGGHAGRGPGEGVAAATSHGLRDASNPLQPNTGEPWPQGGSSEGPPPRSPAGSRLAQNAVEGPGELLPQPMLDEMDAWDVSPSHGDHVHLPAQPMLDGMDAWDVSPSHGDHVHLPAEPTFPTSRPLHEPGSPGPHPQLDMNVVQPEPGCPSAHFILHESSRTTSQVEPDPMGDEAGFASCAEHHPSSPSADAEMDGWGDSDDVNMDSEPTAANEGHQSWPEPAGQDDRAMDLLVSEPGPSSIDEQQQLASEPQDHEMSDACSTHSSAVVGVHDVLAMQAGPSGTGAAPEAVDSGVDAFHTMHPQLCISMPKADVAGQAPPDMLPCASESLAGSWSLPAAPSPHSRSQPQLERTSVGSAHSAVSVPLSQAPLQAALSMVPLSRVPSSPRLRSSALQRLQASHSVAAGANDLNARTPVPIEQPDGLMPRTPPGPTSPTQLIPMQQAPDADPSMVATSMMPWACHPLALPHQQPLDGASPGFSQEGLCSPSPSWSALQRSGSFRAHCRSSEALSPSLQHSPAAGLQGGRQSGSGERFQPTWSGACAAAERSLSESLGSPPTHLQQGLAAAGRGNDAAVSPPAWQPAVKVHTRRSPTFSRRGPAEGLELPTRRVLHTPHAQSSQLAALDTGAGSPEGASGSGKRQRGVLHGTTASGSLERAGSYGDTGHLVAAASVAKRARTSAAPEPTTPMLRRMCPPPQPFPGQPLACACH